MGEEGLFLLASTALNMDSGNNNTVFSKHNVTIRRMEQQPKRPTVTESVHPSPGDIPDTYQLTCAQQLLAKVMLHMDPNAIQLNYSGGRTASLRLDIEYICTNGWNQLMNYNCRFMYAIVITVMFNKEEETGEKGHRFVTFLPSETTKILQRIGVIDNTVEVDDNDKNAFLVLMDAIGTMTRTRIYSYRTNRM